MRVAFGQARADRRWFQVQINGAPEMSSHLTWISQTTSVHQGRESEKAIVLQ